MNFSVHPSATPLTDATCFATEYAASQEKHCRCCRSDNKKRQKHPEQTEFVQTFKRPNATIFVREELAPKPCITIRLAKKNAILLQIAAPAETEIMSTIENPESPTCNPTKTRPGKKQSHQESIKGS